MTDSGDPLRMLHDVLDLRTVSEDVFIGHSHPMPGGRVYGGQVLGQSVVAASRTVPEEQTPHSFHGYFLRPGDVTKDITLAVDRIHDGRSFSRRRVQALQGDVPIFSGIASFQRENDGIDTQSPMPDVPGPDEVPDLWDRLREDSRTREHPELWGFLQGNPMQTRPLSENIRLDPPREATPSQMQWVRITGPLGDDPALHRAALAYLSDFTIQEPVLRRAGVSWAMPGLSSASLDHALWWHRFARADEWLLYVQESPSARGSRGLAFGRLYAQDGALVASVAQEIMMRIPLSSDREE